MANRILILGESGQVASHLKRLLPDATAWGRDQIDWLHPRDAVARIVEFAPTHVINAVAYTAVDKAEDEPAVAWQINVEAPKQMAIAASRVEAVMIHLSTDYVFDGQDPQGYGADSPKSPVNIYGASKYAGELAVALHNESSWTIRASWVFSQYRNNFLKTMLSLFTQRSEISVVADQFGRPTYAGDIARLCVNLIESANVPWGTYHFSGGPVCSWHQFAEAIATSAFRLDILKRLPAITAIKTSEYPTRAIRPLHSVLNGSSELSQLSAGVGDWSRGLTAALSDLALEQDK